MLSRVLDVAQILADFMIGNPALPVCMIRNKLMHGTPFFELRYDEHVVPSEDSSKLTSPAAATAPAKSDGKSSEQIQCDYEMPDLVKRSYQQQAAVTEDKITPDQPDPAIKFSVQEVMNFPVQFSREVIHLLIHAGTFPVHVAAAAGHWLKEKGVGSNESKGTSGNGDEKPGDGLRKSQPMAAAPQVKELPVHRKAPVTEAASASSTAVPQSPQVKALSAPEVLKTLTDLLAEFPVEVFHTLVAALQFPVHLVKVATRRVSNSSSSSIAQSSTIDDSTTVAPARPISTLWFDFPVDVYHTLTFAVSFPFHVLSQCFLRMKQLRNTSPTLQTDALSDLRPQRLDKPSSQSIPESTTEMKENYVRPLSTLLSDFPRDVLRTFATAIKFPVYFACKPLQNVSWKDSPKSCLQFLLVFSKDVLNTFVQGAMVFLQIFTWGSPRDVLGFHKGFAWDVLNTFQQAFGCFLSILLSPVKLFSASKEASQTDSVKEGEISHLKQSKATGHKENNPKGVTERVLEPQKNVKGNIEKHSVALQKALLAAPKAILDFTVTFVTDVRNTLDQAKGFILWLLFRWPKRNLQDFCINAQTSKIAIVFMLSLKAVLVVKDAIKWIIDQLLKKSEEEKLEEEFDIDDLDLDELLKLLKAAEDDIGSLDMLKRKVEAARRPKKLERKPSGAEDEKELEMNVDALKKVVEKRDVKRKQIEAERNAAKEAAKKAAAEQEAAEKAAAEVEAKKVRRKEKEAKEKLKAEKAMEQEAKMTKAKQGRGQNLNKDEDMITAQKASKFAAGIEAESEEDEYYGREEVVEDWIVPQKAFKTYSKGQAKPKQQRVEVEEEIIVPQKAYLTTNSKMNAAVEERQEVEEEIIVPQKAYLTTNSKMIPAFGGREEVEEEIIIPQRAYQTTETSKDPRLRREEVEEEVIVPQTAYETTQKGAKKQQKPARVEVEEDIIVPQEAYLLYKTGDQKTDAILHKHKIRDLKLQKELEEEIEHSNTEFKRDAENEEVAEEDMEEEFKEVYAQGRSTAAKLKQEAKGLTRKPSPIIKVQRAVVVQTTKDAACDTADFPDEDDASEELDDSKLMPRKTKPRSTSKPPRTLLDKVRKSMAQEESSDLEEEEEELMARKVGAAHKYKPKDPSNKKRTGAASSSPNMDSGRPKSKNSSSYSHFSSEEISDSDFIGDWDDSVCEDAPILPKNHPLSRSSSFRKSLTRRPDSSIGGGVEVRRSASGIDISIPILGPDELRSSDDPPLGSESYDMFAKAVQETTEKFERTLAKIADQYANAITEQSYQLKRSFSEQNFQRPGLSSRASDYSEEMDSGDGSHYFANRRNLRQESASGDSSNTRLTRDTFSRRSANDADSAKKSSPPEINRSGFSRHSIGATSGGRKDHSTSPCRTPNLHSPSTRFHNHYSTTDRFAERHRKSRRDEERLRKFRSLSLGPDVHHVLAPSPTPSVLESSVRRDEVGLSMMKDADEEILARRKLIRSLKVQSASFIGHRAETRISEPYSPLKDYFNKRLRKYSRTKDSQSPAEYLNTTLSRVLTNEKHFVSSRTGKRFQV